MKYRFLKQTDKVQINDEMFDLMLSKWVKLEHVYTSKNS
jgi:hypothetical protein